VTHTRRLMTAEVVASPVPLKPGTAQTSLGTGASLFAHQGCTLESLTASFSPPSARLPDILVRLGEEGAGGRKVPELSTFSYKGLKDGDARG